MNANTCHVSVAMEVQCICARYTWYQTVCAMLESHCVCDVRSASACMLPHIAADIMFAIRKRKEKKRKDNAFRRQFNEKPSIIPGCPDMFAITDQALTAFCICNICLESIKTDPSGGSQRVAVGCSPVRLSLGSAGSCLSCITLALTSSEVIVCFPQLSLSLQGPPGSS